MLASTINEIKFNSPILVASGTYGYGDEVADIAEVDKLGGVITKSVTLHPREGNNPPRITETPSGMLNSIGLANPGVEVFCKDKMPYLNLGSGPEWYDPLTIGLDINGEGEDIGYNVSNNCDIEFDLGSFDPLPFEKGRFQGIYTSHCLEHLREKSVLHVLSECKRILKNNGCLRITLPDLSLYFKKYNEQDLNFFSWISSKDFYQYDTWLRFICREFIFRFYEYSL